VSGIFHAHPCFKAVETVSEGRVSPMAVGMAIAASLNRFSAKLTNGVFSA